MTVEVVDERKTPLGQRIDTQVLPTPHDSSGAFVRLSVEMGKRDNPALHASVFVEVKSPDVVDVFDREVDHEGVIKHNIKTYVGPEINEARLQRKIPVTLLGIRVPFVSRTLSVRWRETRHGDYPKGGMNA